MFTAPLVTEKFVELNDAIPFAIVEASSIVIVVPDVPELARVNAPDIAEPDVPPITERTPVFVIVTAPVAPLTEIPVPATFEVTPVFERVTVPPSETGDPLTPSPVPPVTVMLEF